MERQIAKSNYCAKGAFCLLRRGELLLFRTDKGKFEGMTGGERHEMYDACVEYDDHFRANGHWAGGEVRQPSVIALTLYWRNGKVAMTDGPYAETKEQLGGILFLEPRGPNRESR